MMNFNMKLANLIANDDKDGARDWVEEINNTMRYTEVSQVESDKMKRQMRIIKDWIADCDKS